MYKAEVLAKFPVVQHVRFGALLCIREAQNPPVADPWVDEVILIQDAKYEITSDAKYALLYYPNLTYL